MPKFKIVRMVARFDDRDCIVGWAGRVIATANTAAWAFVLASREDQDHDVYAEVREIATDRKVTRTFPTAEYILPF